MPKILCPNTSHKEDTPSFEIYPDGHGHCFGCGYRTEAVLDTVPALPQFVEDVQATLSYIKTLPVETIRGLELPTDGEFYYIVWPNGTYYKKRKVGVDKDKYRSPVGVKKSLYHVQRPSPVLIIIEGELNALSVSHVSHLAVCSPGGVSDLYGTKASGWKRSLSTYLNYPRIAIIVDSDGPGIKAGIGLAGFMRQYSSNVVLDAWETDANDILQGPNGKEKLRERLSKTLEMF